MVLLIERQKSEQTEKELKLKTEALDYLNEELARIEQLAKETGEKKQNLSNRLQQLLKGIEDIFKWVYFRSICRKIVYTGNLLSFIIPSDCWLAMMPLY